MSNGSWTDSVLADGYSNFNTPTGRVSARPFPGGQKIGAGSVLSNNSFSQQAQTAVRQICRYVTGNQIDAEIKRQVCVDISTPSSRLRTGIQLYVERDGVIRADPPMPGSTPCFANLLAVGVNPVSGARSTMQVIQAYNPPFSVPIDPVYRDTRLQINVSNNNWIIDSDFPTGVLVLVVTWEPTTLIDPNELNRLYANCSASVPSTVNI